MSFLVDTNVISELTRRRPNAAVLAWSQSVAVHHVSAISVDELWYGISRRPTLKLDAWLSNYLNSHTVLPIDQEVARRAGQLRGVFSLRGIVRDQPDMLIAATAQAHGLTLVTRNSKDFEGCGISLLNPFDNP
jgi:predicted nucleic acid-binding protein